MIRVRSAEDWNVLEGRAIAFVLNLRFTDEELHWLFDKGFDEACFSEGRELASRPVWMLRDLMREGHPMLDAWKAVSDRCNDDPKMGPGFLLSLMDLYEGPSIHGEGDYETTAELMSACFPTWDRDFKPLVDRSLG